MVLLAHPERVQELPVLDRMQYAMAKEFLTTPRRWLVGYALSLLVGLWTAGRRISAWLTSGVERLALPAPPPRLAAAVHARSRSTQARGY